MENGITKHSERAGVDPKSHQMLQCTDLTICPSVSPKKSIPTHAPLRRSKGEGKWSLRRRRKDGCWPPASTISGTSAGPDPADQE
jgi:hypothetical protein